MISFQNVTGILHHLLTISNTISTIADLESRTEDMEILTEVAEAVATSEDAVGEVSRIIRGESHIRFRFNLSIEIRGECHALPHEYTSTGRLRLVSLYHNNCNSNKDVRIHPPPISAITIENDQTAMTERRVSAPKLITINVPDSNSSSR
jgi:hypothetical protein